MSDVLTSNPSPPVDQAEELQLPIPNEETEQNSEIHNNNTPTEGDNKKDKKKNTISDRLYEEKKKQEERLKFKEAKLLRQQCTFKPKIIQNPKNVKIKPRPQNTNLALYEQSKNPRKVEGPNYSFKPTITNYVPPKPPQGVKPPENSGNETTQVEEKDQKGKKKKIFTRLYNLSKEESIKKEKLTKEILSEENKELKFKPTINKFKADKNHSMTGTGNMDDPAYDRLYQGAIEKKKKEEEMKKMYEQKPPTKRLDHKQQVSSVNRLYGESKTRQAKLEKIKFQKQQKELGECTFSPRITKKSEKLADGAGTAKVNVWNRLIIPDKIKYRESNEISNECTFKPQINPKSRNIKVNLTELYQKGKEDLKERKKIERNDPNYMIKADPECTFKPDLKIGINERKALLLHETPKTDIPKAKKFDYDEGATTKENKGFKLGGANRVNRAQSQSIESMQASYKKNPEEIADPNNAKGRRKSFEAIEEDEYQNYEAEGVIYGEGEYVEGGEGEVYAEGDENGYYGEDGQYYEYTTEEGVLPAEGEYENGYFDENGEWVAYEGNEEDQQQQQEEGVEYVEGEGECADGEYVEGGEGEYMVGDENGYYGEDGQYYEYTTEEGAAAEGEEYTGEVERAEEGNLPAETNQ